MLAHLVHHRQVKAAHLAIEFSCNPAPAALDPPATAAQQITGNCDVVAARQHARRTTASYCPTPSPSSDGVQPPPVGHLFEEEPVHLQPVGRVECDSR
jgi:hypothetical protein